MGGPTSSAFKAIAQELKELRLLARNHQKRINELCDARQAKTWAQIATPKKIAQVTGLGKTEVIIVPDFRVVTEIKERAGTATLTAVKAQLGSAVEAARRIPDGSNALVWSGEDRYIQGVELLLELATKWDLELVTTPGEPTWTKPGCRSSIIDLFWRIGDVQCRYEGAWEWLGSDHTPQLVMAWLNNVNPTKRRPTPNWKLMHPEEVELAAESIAVGHASSPEQLDDATDHFIRQSINIRQATTPMKRGTAGHRSKAFWNCEVDPVFEKGRAATPEKQYRILGKRSPRGPPLID